MALRKLDPYFGRDDVLFEDLPQPLLDMRHATELFFDLLEPLEFLFRLNDAAELTLEQAEAEYAQVCPRLSCIDPDSHFHLH